jgi:2-keto-4-pentenoate hydratase/2-oxohepta-3-ene-1,7-dioic acid hydratase in catechol pathway
MRLASYGDGRIGVVTGHELTDISETVDALAPGSGISLMRRLIGSWPAVSAALAAPRGQGQPWRDATLLPPVPDPSKVIAAPVNYLDHQQEMNTESHVDGLGVFLKAPSSLLGHEATVRLPYHDRRFDHEAEVALVIGRRAREVEAHEALDYVFGYTGLLDITMRGGEDRSTRKSFDTFTPMGPWLVTADEFGAPDDVPFELALNGRIKQKASTRDLIWGVRELIAYASSVMTLLPGDVITTGTPAGVGPISDGDLIELNVARVGQLAVHVSARGAIACPTRGAGRGPVPPPADRGARIPPSRLPPVALATRIRVISGPRPRRIVRYCCAFRMRAPRHNRRK